MQASLWRGSRRFLSALGLICAVVALSLPAFSLPALATPPSPVIERGRECLRWFLEGRHDALYDAFSDQMRSAFPLEQISAFRQQIQDNAGIETELIEERAEVQDGNNVYIRRIRVEKLDTPMDVVMAFNAKNEIDGFLITTSPSPHPSPHADRELQTEFRLPVDGEWIVDWGGRTIEQNFHAASREQRFAVDLVMLEDGHRHREDGSANEHYYCFDAPIYAPAAGVVVAAVDNVPDNVPGVVNPEQRFGNYVIIDHGNSEFSVFAHLKQGTVAVDVGQGLEPGDEIGHCGNSGNSSEPHLHIHVQNGPDFEKAEGLPLRFCNYYVNDLATSCSEPERNQRVRRE